jgi:hypothetical protein
MLIDNCPRFETSAVILLGDPVELTSRCLGRRAQQSEGPRITCSASWLPAAAMEMRSLFARNLIAFKAAR